MKKNIIANVIGKFWSALSGFLFIPLYIKFLGFESYSVISFTLIVAGVMAVLDAGLTATLSREFARKDQLIVEKFRVFKTLETCYFLIIIFTGIFIFFFSDFIAVKWLNLKIIDPERVSLFIKIIGFEAGFQMLFRFYMGGVLGFEQQIKANIFQVGWGMLRNGVVVLVIYFVPSLEMFFTWQLISTIIFTILMRFSILRILSGKYILGFKPTLEKEIFFKIGRFAGGMLLISLIASLNTQMDKLTISKLLDINILGYYTLAISIATGIYILVSPISIALLPRFTALYSKGEKENAKQLYKKINLFVSILLFSFMANIMFQGNKIIWIWTGNSDLAEKANIFLPILSFSFSMLALATIPYDIAIANGYTKLNNLLGILSLFLTLPGYWIATKLYGGIGSAYVFCLVQTMITLVYLYFINKKFLSLTLYELFIKNLLLPLIVCLAMAYGLTFIPNVFKDNRILTFLLIGIFTATTLFSGILIFVPFRELKNIFNLRKNNLSN
ncbi:oligosaccharide flippase family protein [Chryseobacterium formosus]|uniref:Oligosaccharide flippase family protein n=1 Tax=Chryseobacterium formosus TaxID=1537363 RepID=A0ABT3XPF7_9FLAO|nr:oligosaccharide flippase family protein [Chryseobacterium formosus]MCX8523531.1 oligosaccharide flippase family protein [Chryseobacterium formosus]